MISIKEHIDGISLSLHMNKVIQGNTEQSNTMYLMLEILLRTSTTNYVIKIEIRIN